MHISGSCYSIRVYLISTQLTFPLSCNNTLNGTQKNTVGVALGNRKNVTMDSRHRKSSEWSFASVPQRGSGHFPLRFLSFPDPSLPLPQITALSFPLQGLFSPHSIKSLTLVDIAKINKMKQRVSPL